MSLIPSLDCILQCSRTPEEICRTLCLVTLQQHKMFLGSSAEFTGTVSASGFEIVPRLGYRNSFIPIIRGWVGTDREASRIRIQMRMSPFVSVFCVLWFAALLLCLLCGVLSIFAGGIFSALPLLAYGMVMFAMGQIFIRIGFYRPARRSLKRIRELLGGTEVQEEGKKIWECF